MVWLDAMDVVFYSYFIAENLTKSIIICETSCEVCCENLETVESYFVVFQIEMLLCRKGNS